MSVNGAKEKKDIEKRGKLKNTEIELPVMKETSQKVCLVSFFC